ncbi:hypothetical protein evm_012440 [Chilo suppressalis]|nr:hypothetical protein evm_012440 [Chilo suppressalis]
MAATPVFCLVVFTLVTFGNAVQNKQCTVDTYGDLRGAPVQLKPVPLNPPTTSWDLTIPQPCNVAGVVVKVCDPDSPPAPTLYVFSTNEATIKRNGWPLLHNAIVDTTVFCTTSNIPVNSVRVVPKVTNMEVVNYDNNVWESYE